MVVGVSQAVDTGDQPQIAGLAEADKPRRHVLDLDDFQVGEINLVLDNAGAMKEVLHRDIKKVPTLRGRVIVTLFYEPSTRTRISFEEAEKVLSGATAENPSK